MNGLIAEEGYCVHMKNNQKERTYSQDSDKLMIFFLIFLVLLLIFTLISWYGLDHIRTDVNGMALDIEYLKQQGFTSSSIEQTEFLKTVEFMENETEKYRVFVQQQQQFIISLVGLLGTGIMAVMTFLGVKSRKDISKVVREEYKERVDSEIEWVIGGHDKLQYLEQGIKREETARKKRILFLLQENADESLTRIYRSLCAKGYHADKKTAGGILEEALICTILKDYELVIYQVSPSEFDKENCLEDSKLNYVNIAKECNRKNVFCVLYCKGRLKMELCDLSFYVNTANFGSTVLERIHNILYYM